ncbi:uncharacterized protein LOC120112581 [Phoenix dactylifera]|uniref:Uncharacterized protein LOC120112581 n=1 Tax=Phoenix dactylifera TaxID=42345 RepID=A0A8B9ARC7_PHODC|nr:uncharacterized protein LOC120112581 [Phoenix dactylifera]
MGSCFSSSTTTDRVQSPMVRVICTDGSLREYSTAVKVYEVLGQLHPSCFLCSSDELYIDADIPALGSNQSLELGQLYFMLPVAKLEHRLTGPEMAALAVKASLALAAAEERGGHGRRMIQVMPVEVVGGVSEEEEERLARLERFDGFSHGISVSRKKTGIGASLRVKLVGRASRMRLSTIDELGT